MEILQRKDIRHADPDILAKTNFLLLHLRDLHNVNMLLETSLVWKLSWIPTVIEKGISIVVRQLYEMIWMLYRLWWSINHLLWVNYLLTSLTLPVLLFQALLIRQTIFYSRFVYFKRILLLRWYREDRRTCHLTLSRVTYTVKTFWKIRFSHSSRKVICIGRQYYL